MAASPDHSHDSDPRGYRLPRHLRLTSPRQFEVVYDAQRRQHAGPLLVFAKPNDLEHSRLGMSLPRRVGTAARRNRIRRLLRESFRLLQHHLPQGYDLVINVRPHEPLPLADYQRLLLKAAQRLHQSWTSEKNNQSPPEQSPPAP